MLNINKPFNDNALQKTIELAFYNHTNSFWSETTPTWQNDIMIRDSFFIKTGHKLEKVKIADITYIEVELRYISLYTLDNRFVARMGLKEILEKLPPTDFVQVHRNFIINANHISNVNTKASEIEIGNKTIPISKRHEEYFLNRLNLIT